MLTSKLTPLHLLMTLIALIAFAGNSVLCRLALEPNSSGLSSIDATSFTLLRLLSGAFMLWLIIYCKNLCKQTNSLKDESVSRPRQWLAPFSLFLYAACFSYAYILLETGVGALILFASVQLTMICSSVIAREPLGWPKSLGVLIAFFGLVFLVTQTNGEASELTTASTYEVESSSSHESESLPFIGTILMIISGIAWGVFSLIGRGSSQALLETRNNFLYSLPFALLLIIIYLFLPIDWSIKGLVLALSSGMLTSGLGYAIWYYALSALTRIQASVVQLSVPVIAALGGLIWVDEAISLELLLAQAIVLGGIALVLFGPNRVKR